MSFVHVGHRVSTNLELLELVATKSHQGIPRPLLREVKRLLRIWLISFLTLISIEFALNYTYYLM